MGSGFSKMKKQQRALAEQVEKMQQEIQSTEYTGSVGDGLVTVVLSGEKQLKSIKIKKECVNPEDVEALEDLIYGAFKEAGEKVDEATSAFKLPT